jgi:chemotaxis methyl-accepting protein methylase
MMKAAYTSPATNRSILESRLREKLRDKKLQTPAEYYAILIKDKEELKILLDSVTTNLTRFFRNQAHFDAIEHFVIPELLKLRAAERKLRFWSAGCSTGEEPYTISMLLKQTAGRLELRGYRQRHKPEVPHGGQGRVLPDMRTGHTRRLPARISRSGRTATR